MTDSDLFTRREEVRLRLMQDKLLLKSLNDEIYEKYAPEAKQKLYNQGKDFGTTNLYKNDRKIKVIFKKNVVWDTSTLQTIADSMRPDLSEHYITKTLEIKETRYKEAPPELQNLFNEARTVKQSGTIIEVTEE